MSSLIPACALKHPIGGKRTLQRLRRQAGFRSAKDFAESLGIPSSTYARYERAGDGVDCGIPLPAAWQIADAFGCSIDLVVGREDIDALEAEDIQPRYSALSAEGRRLVESYLAYVELGEQGRAHQGSRLP
ncbi:helix-turn-helix domain-containing protein [Enorma phocaeensis]|uniref:Helix-turn-helix transcriptional regulator n=1 Tax=Enorma phocaeensis TaxID=1871019 RepID=A0A921IVL9_9ACTN|nr:helix-turn-helix transcriptional regulator [Enorma phocaeensis]HJG37735.1 helix-turn-helix transcriptional regulator [Enorma phocaeensis]